MLGVPGLSESDLFAKIAECFSNGIEVPVDVKMFIGGYSSQVLQAPVISSPEKTAIKNAPPKNESVR